MAFMDLGWRVEFWWQLEQFAGRLWSWICKDGVSCWFDPVPAFCSQRRYDAENRRLGIGRYR